MGELPEYDFGNSGDLRILLVEDKAAHQKVLKLMLNRLGYSADLTENGSDALRAMEQKHYDVILWDIRCLIWTG
jgi:CheY-like chemotaxis protein